MVAASRYGLLGLLAPCLWHCGRDPVQAERFRFQLNLSDPCNQTVLADPDADIDMIEVQIDAPGLGEPVHAKWHLSDRQGMLEDIPTVSEATVTVLASSPDGAVVAAATTGYVDIRLEPSELSMVLGRTGTFIQTTDTAAAAGGTSQCTQLASARVEHTATPLPDGGVLILGGMELDVAGPAYLTSTERFDPATGQLLPAAAMTLGRAGHSATLLTDGRVLVVGGKGHTPIGEVEIWRSATVYDPRTDAFVRTLILAVPRVDHSATLLADGRVLIAGGRRSDTELLMTTEIFDPSSESLCPGPPLAGERADHGALAISATTVALVGGTGAAGALDDVEFLVVGACGEGESVPGPVLSQQRSHPLVAMLPTGTAFLVGGGFEATTTAIEALPGLDSIEIVKIDPQAPQGSSVACQGFVLSEPRGGAFIAGLAEGFLIAGGIGAGGEALSSAEILRIDDLEECAMTATPAMGLLSTPRAGAAVAPLVGGDLLVTGGVVTGASGVAPVDQTEIYVRAR